MRNRLPLLRDLPREVAVLATIAFFVALGFGIVVPSIPIFAKSFDVSNLAAGAVIAAFAAMRFVSSPGAGALANRFSERSVLSVGLLIVAGSSAMAGLAQTYVQLLVWRGIGGLGSAMFSVSALALLLRVTHLSQRGRASAAFSGGFLLGGVAGPAVGAIVLRFSIRAPFFFYAGTLLIAAIVCIVFLAKARIVEREEEVLHEDSPTVTKEIGGWAALRKALGNPAYRAVIGVNLSNGLVSFGLRSALIPLFVIEGLKQNQSLAGYGFLVTAGVQAGLLVPAGKYADFRGRKPVILRGVIATLIGMIALTIAGQLVLDLPDNPVPSIVLFFTSMALTGAAAAFLGSAPAAVVGDISAGSRSGIVVATYSMMSDFGAIIAPLLAGYLSDSFGFGWAFASGAIVVSLALILVARMPETLKRTNPVPA